MAGCGIGLAVPAAVAADGGPLPPVQGGRGVTAPGAHVRYVPLGTPRGTVVAALRRDDGTVLRWRLVRGWLGVAAVASDGSRTGLAADGGTLVLPSLHRRYPPRRSGVVVLDPRNLRVRERIVLPGWSELDALSPDGRWLYFTHYPARDQLRYEVRAYDLRRGRLLPRPIVDPREPDEKMLGLPVSRTTSTDGRWAYTLYQRPSAALFVHALDTRGRRAFCVDLPALAGGDSSALRLNLDRGGRRLSVDSVAGPQALVDTRSFAVSRPASDPPRRRRDANVAGARRSDRAWTLAALPLGGLAAIALIARHRRRQRRPASASFRKAS